MAVSGAAAVLPVATTALGLCTRAALTYLFFDATEALFIEAACDRFIPPDGTRPGAVAAGACWYVDSQLAGPWGAGDLLHRSGAWQPGMPMPTACKSMAPARFFRTALHAIDVHLSQRGTAFQQMPAHGQDAFLASLRNGRVDLGVSSRGFFELLLQLTVEGFFSRSHGRLRDRIPWQLTSFPGAFATAS